jgi:hypothetical protein
VELPPHVTALLDQAVAQSDSLIVDLVPGIQQMVAEVGREQAMAMVVMAMQAINGESGLMLETVAAAALLAVADRG